MKEFAARPITSPRLRGEVGIRALARGFRVRGKGDLSDREYSYDLRVAPHPNPLPARGAREGVADRVRRVGRGVLLPLGFALLATLAWETLCRATKVSPVLLPPPSAVWTVLSQNPAILLQHAVPTTIETVVSFAAATLLGVALAVAITFSSWVREALYPNIVMFQLIPKIALAPLFIVWLGVGGRSVIVVGIFIAFFPVVVSTATGLVSAKPEVLQLCRSLTASQWQIFCLARFPYATPFIFAGMKVGVTMAMIGVIVGEFITAQAGLGYIIMFASSAGETATVLAAIVLLCGIGLALFGLVALAEQAMRRWCGGEMPVGGVI